RFSLWPLEPVAPGAALKVAAARLEVTRGRDVQGQRGADSPPGVGKGPIAQIHPMGRQRKLFSHLESLQLRDILGDAAPRGRNGAAEEVYALAQSLAAKGLQQPIIVTEAARKGAFRVIVGRKRLLAA